MVGALLVASPQEEAVCINPSAWVTIPVPTVLARNGYRVRIYLPPREHAPPHVHVVRAGGELVITLGDVEHPPEVMEVYGMRAREVVRAYRIVEAHQEILLEAWRRYHE